LADAKFGAAISLLGGLKPPMHGFDWVLRNAFALREGVSQKILRFDFPLLRGFAPPINCLDQVLRPALAVVVCHAEVVLRAGIPLFRRCKRGIGIRGLLGKPNNAEQKGKKEEEKAANRFHWTDR